MVEFCNNLILLQKKTKSKQIATIQFYDSAAVELEKEILGTKRVYLGKVGFEQMLKENLN